MNNQREHNQIAGHNSRKLFASRLPRFAKCSNNVKKWGMTQKPQDKAIGYQQIQPDKPYERQVICIDIDSPEAGAAWLDAGLPQPQFIIRNPEGHRAGHAHIMWLLETPVLVHDPAKGYRNRKEPWQFYEDVRKGLIKALEPYGADPNYTQTLVKNPLHPYWSTIVADIPPYTLQELSEYIPSAPAVRKPATTRLLPGEGRNCTLFDNLRFWAYGAIRFFNGTFQQWAEKVRKQAEALNTFPQPLPLREVYSTARSVCTFVWSKKHIGTASCIGGERRCKMHSCDRTPALPKEQQTERMRQGQAYAAEQRANTTRAKIRNAMRQLVSKGARLSKAAIARIAGVSRATVHRHADLLSTDGTNSTHPAHPTRTHEPSAYHPEPPLNDTLSAPYASPANPLHPKRGQEVAVVVQAALDVLGKPPSLEDIARILRIPVAAVRHHRAWLDLSQYRRLSQKFGLSLPTAQPAANTAAMTVPAPIPAPPPPPPPTGFPPMVPPKPPERPQASG